MKEQNAISARLDHAKKPAREAQELKGKLLQAFDQHGINMPTQDLIRLLDIAVQNDKALTMADVAENIGSLNGPALCDALNKYTALKSGFDSAGGDKSGQKEPDLDPQVKQEIVKHIKRVYTP